MRLDILGCGTIIQYPPDLKNNSGYLIDRELLFDCGGGILRALRETGLNPASLRYIFLSHYHLDHVADIPLLLMARYLSPDKSEVALKIYGPGDLNGWYGRMASFGGSWVEKVPVRLTVLDGDINIAGKTISYAETGHTDDSVCYRIGDQDGSSLFYSSDSGECDALVRMGRRCDIGLFEASSTEERMIGGHLTPAQAGRIARESGIKKLILTHMYPDVTPEYARRHAAEHFSGEIIVAKDGMCIETGLS